MKNLSLDRYLDARRSALRQLAAAQEDGRIEGEIKGRNEEKNTIARAMFKAGSEITFITQVTGLSLEDIKKLNI